MYTHKAKKTTDINGHQLNIIIIGGSAFLSNYFVKKRKFMIQ